MVYTFGLVKHANIRYRDSLICLSRFELLALLHALSITCDIIHEVLGGADFLTIECRRLSDKELTFLARHSSVCFLAEKDNGMLIPVAFQHDFYLNEDLPEILKYKGKTSASFIRLMINIALSVSDFSSSETSLTLMDPLCGKATSCFCALQFGMNAVGLDLDRKAVREAADYFKRYLELYTLKHSHRALSETIGKDSLPVTEFVFSDTREHYRENNTRSLRLAVGDTAFAAAVCRKSHAHLLIADLPYGVQHAPQFGNRPESFRSRLQRALPAWRNALMPGGVAAVSFNTLTLPAHQVIDLAIESGFTPCDAEFCRNLRHEVEQAVVRDVVFLMNKTL